MIDLKRKVKAAAKQKGIDLPNLQDFELWSDEIWMWWEVEIIPEESVLEVLVVREARSVKEMVEILEQHKEDVKIVRMKSE